MADVLCKVVVLVCADVRVYVISVVVNVNVIKGFALIWLHCNRSTAARGLNTLMNKYKKKHCYNRSLMKLLRAMEKLSRSAAKHKCGLNENKSWKLMWTKSHARKRVRTLADSGFSCTIFTDSRLFTDYQPYQSPFQQLVEPSSLQAEGQ